MEIFRCMEQLKFATRVGKHRLIIVTSTPRKTEIIRKLNEDKKTFVTVGTMYDNKENLEDSYIEDIVDEFSGTSKGRQEIYGDIIGEVDGALFKQHWIDNNRIRRDGDSRG